MADEEHARIKVVVIEDDPMALEWFAEKLDTPRIAVVACCQTAQAGLQAVEAFQPVVALVDMMLDLDPRAGVRVIEKITACWSQVRCCVVTNTDLYGQYVREAIRAGAQGYWRKGYAKALLPAIVERLANGEPTIEPSLLDPPITLDPQRQRYPHRDEVNSPHLSARKVEVLKRLQQGKSNKEIAHELGISVHTVKTYVHQIMTAYEISGNGGRERTGFQARIEASKDADRKRPLHP